MKVMIEKVSYGLTTKNGDDYEKCHLEGVVVGGDVHGAINQLKEVVCETLRINIPMNESQVETTPPPAPVEAEVEAPTKKKKEAKKKKPLDEAVDKAEDTGARVSRKQKIMNKLNKLKVEFNPRLNADKLQAILDEHDEDSEKKVSVKEKIANANYQTYDRTIDEHMDQLCDLLDDEWPSWEDDADMVKKEISKKLVGTEFLDEKGKVLPSFMEALVGRVEFCIAKLGEE